MANGVARALTRRGFARGDRVAILSANRAEYLAAYFGIMRAGFVAVPVNFKFPRQTIHFILRDAGAKLVFCDPPRCADCPTGPSSRACSATEGARAGFDRFLDPGPFDAIVPAPARAGDVPLHVGLDRHAQGRRALAPEPYLGRGDAARARTSTGTAISSPRRSIT